MFGTVGSLGYVLCGEIVCCVALCVLCSVLSVFLMIRRARRFTRLPGRSFWPVGRFGRSVGRSFWSVGRSGT